jgi:hypothetical protein
MTVSQAGPNWEHHAMAKVLIIGGSRGNGLETAKGRSLGGTFGAGAGAVSPKNSY